MRQYCSNAITATHGLHNDLSADPVQICVVVGCTTEDTPYEQSAHVRSSLCSNVQTTYENVLMQLHCNTKQPALLSRVKKEIRAVSCVTSTDLNAKPRRCGARTLPDHRAHQRNLWVTGVSRKAFCSVVLLLVCNE